MQEGLQKGYLMIDTHIHLDSEQYDSDLEDVINSALKDGVEQFIIPGADPKDLTKAIKIAELHENIFFSVGAHPYHWEEYDEALFEQYINHPKCVAVGECGLDYYRLPESQEEIEREKVGQKEVFVAQIELAKRYNKPLIVHIRDASNDSKELLLEHNSGEVGGVLHCFNADEQLLSLTNLNFYFGIGGVLTFKNAKKLVNILPKIPQEKLVIETDGPYLTPHPFRGTRNEPKYTLLVAERISEILNIEYKDVINLTDANAKRLFLI